MATSGPNQSGAVSEFDDGWAPWASVASGITDDNSYATVVLDSTETSLSNFLDYTTFGTFTGVGDGDSVTAVTIEWAVKISAGTATFYTVQLLKGGVLVGDPFTVSADIGASETYVSTGEVHLSGDFNTTLVGSELTSGFGVRIQALSTGGSQTVSADACRITLTYTPATPTLAVTGTADGGTYALGSVALNTNITHQFTIQNTGTGADTLGTLEISGTGWSIDAGDDPSSDALAASGSTTVTVIGNFATAGAKTGTLTIPSNDAASPYVINLTATALAADGNRNLLLMGCG